MPKGSNLTKEHNKAAIISAWAKRRADPELMAAYLATISEAQKKRHLREKKARKARK